MPSLKPGALSTGCLIVGVLALLAHAGALGAGLVWDDVELVARDPRVRDLSFVFEAFGDSFFGPFRHNEMYRPVVNASLTLDWFLSGSTPGDVRVWPFHGVNWLFHGANGALAYVFLAELTGRRLGAPLLAATLFAVHPLGVEPVTWIAGRCDLLATFFGLASGVLLIRSARQPKLVFPAVALYGVSLLAKASLATVPVVVALGVMAYRDVPVRRLLGRRLLSRFAVFLVPAALWFVARAAVLGSPVPVAGGRRWHHVDLVEGILGVGRAITLYVGNLILPARLCGDYASDRLSVPGVGGDAGIGWFEWLGWAAPVGLSITAVGVWFGGTRLYRSRFAFPALAFFVALVPVLQFVPIGAIAADRFLYFPMLFAFLFVGEGLETLFQRTTTATAIGVTFLMVASLGALTMTRTSVWESDVAFNRDVLVSYPQARRARQRLAAALAARDGPGDRGEAKEILRESISRLSRPNEECRILGALALEEGDLDRAEPLLRRALDLAADPLARAQGHYHLAVLAKARGETQEAIVHADRALRQIPGFPPAEEFLRRVGKR